MAVAKVIITVTREDTPRPDVLDNRRCAQSIFDALVADYEPLILDITKRDFKNIPVLKARIKSFKPVCIFNIFEGFSDDSLKEADFTRILASLKIPFTGNGFNAINTCLDKNRVRRILAQNHISVPRGILAKSVKDADKIDFGFPVFIKPNREDASVGIDNHSLVRDKVHLERYLREKVGNFPGGVVVEEFIPGREYNCGFLGNSHFELMNVSVIDYEKYSDFKPFLSYDAKWNQNTPEFKAIIPAIDNHLDEAVRKSIIRLCRKAGHLLGCRGYFRVDLREQNQCLYVLDVNPNPDINVDSGFMRQAYSKGYTFGEVILRMVRSAITS